MGLQLIAQAHSGQVLFEKLGGIAEDSEIFHVEGALWGISVPTKVLDEVTEEEVRQRLSSFHVFDLYEGKWTYS